MSLSNPKPFLKWVGGKGRILNKLKKYFPKKYNNYYEPFLGGGSVFFNFLPNNSTITDLNKTLINTYICIRDDFDNLYKYLQLLETKNNSEDYYKYRDEFNKLRLEGSNNTYISALMIYLNKTGYGGVYRENKKCGYNVPYGKYKSINITDKKNLLKIKKSLKDVSISCSNYRIISKAKKDDFIYLDPPYHKENKTSFTKYQKDYFNEEEQKKLCNLLKELDKKGVKFLLSNSNTEFINTLYNNFTIDKISVGRHINNKNKKETKNKLNEVLIYNYNEDMNIIVENKDVNTDNGVENVNISDENLETKKQLHLKFLLNKEVVNWTIKGGIWSNKKQNREDNKFEKEWGNKIIQQKTNQWTAKLGEYILEEVLLVLEEKCWRPKKINGYKPDWETPNAIYEVKTRNWTTTGTAGEKFLGTPYKYSDIPILYKKPLYIVVIAYQEYEAINKFKLFDDKSERKNKIINLWKDFDIHYIKFSDLLRKIKIL